MATFAKTRENVNARNPNRTIESSFSLIYIRRSETILQLSSSRQEASVSLIVTKLARVSSIGNQSSADRIILMHVPGDETLLFFPRKVTKRLPIWREHLVDTP